MDRMIMYRIYRAYTDAEGTECVKNIYNSNEYPTSEAFFRKLKSKHRGYERNEDHKGFTYHFVVSKEGFCSTRSERAHV